MSSLPTSTSTPIEPPSVSFTMLEPLEPLAPLDISSSVPSSMSTPAFTVLEPLDECSLPCIQPPVPEAEYDVWPCPHCAAEVLIYKQERNCQIFRHGVFKNGGMQIPPHAPQQMCEQWIQDGLIFGCGKPFRIENNALVICDYI